MNKELFAILEHLEREKGVKREVLLQAIEVSLISAAKKSLGPKLAEGVVVKIDPQTCEIKVLSGKDEVTPTDFGRIAAQTAKQIIFQKIREAEREVIFGEFKEKIGKIVSGTVHRFEKGDIIVDLGKTEGILPRREQCPKEEYRQGEIIRSYVLEVNRTNHGPQIILSRSHPQLVRSLFELEVPEIFDKIVEIKTVSREAGERSKIAVWSRDEKVDSVGACVGMRGRRVKNIVRELREEKIDIIRWAKDPKEYIAQALSPAKVAEIRLNEKEKRAHVLVPDDQLSLAIGKRGQNVRLASKLTGWEIDLETVTSAKPAKEPLLQSIAGVGPKIEKVLVGGGFETIAKIATSSVSDLVKLPGIGKKTAEKIIASANALGKDKDKNSR